MKRTAILIAGQGLAGSLLALELWKHSVDFLIMDAPDMHSSSKVAAGLYNPVVFRTLKKVGMIDQLIPAMYESYYYAESLFGVKLLNQIPSLKIIDQMDIPLWQNKGDLSSFVQSIEKVTEIPGIKQGKAAVVIKPSGYLDVKMFVESTSVWLREKGLLVEERLDYGQLKLTHDKVQINDMLEADKVVFCEGAHAVNNPWFGNAGFSLNKGEIIDVEAPGLSEEFIIRDEVFVLPLGNDRFRIGATYHHGSLDLHPGREGLNELVGKLNKIIDVPYRVVNHWAGIRPAVKDRTPLLGAHPEFPQLNIFNGLGSRGVMLGPHWAKEMRKFLTLKDYVLQDMVWVGRYF